jgi:hypothetical protein
MKVSVYFNLTKKVYSVRSEEGPEKGRVIAHASSLALEDVRFTVRQSGNAKVRAEGQKNVHAFVKGTLMSLHSTASLTDAGERIAHKLPDADWLNCFGMAAKVEGQRITYNPYKDTSFVLDNDTRTPVKAASDAYLGKDGVHARNPVRVGFDF